MQRVVKRRSHTQAANQPLQRGARAPARVSGFAASCCCLSCDAKTMSACTPSWSEYTVSSQAKFDRSPIRGQMEVKYCRIRHRHASFFVSGRSPLRIHIDLLSSRERDARTRVCLDVCVSVYPTLIPAQQPGPGPDAWGRVEHNPVLHRPCLLCWAVPVARNSRKPRPVNQKVVK